MGIHFSYALFLFSSLHKTVLKHFLEVESLKTSIQKLSIVHRGFVVFIYINEKPTNYALGICAAVVHSLFWLLCFSFQCRFVQCCLQLCFSSVSMDLLYCVCSSSTKSCWLTAPHFSGARHWIRALLQHYSFKSVCIMSDSVDSKHILRSHAFKNNDIELNTVCDSFFFFFLVGMQTRLPTGT